MLLLPGTGNSKLPQPAIARENLHHGMECSFMIYTQSLLLQARDKMNKTGHRVVPVSLGILHISYMIWPSAKTN